MDTIVFIPINANPYNFSPSALLLLDFVDCQTGLVISCMYPLKDWVQFTSK